MPAPQTAPVNIRPTLIRAVALPLGLALLLGIVLLVEIFYLLRLQSWVEHTDRVLEQTHELQRLLVDHETGVRGYLLTGDESFLEPYLAARPITRPAMDRLEQLVADRSEQAAHLQRTREQYEQWIDFAQEVATRRRGGEDVGPLERTGRGRRHIDAMRDQLSGLIALERRLRVERVAASRRAARVVIASAGGLSLLLGLVLALVTRRQLMEVNAAYRRSLATIEAQTEALRASEDRYRRLVDLSPDGIFVQTEGIVRYANRSIATIVGAADPSELIGRRVLDLIHADYHEAVRERIRLILERKQDVPLMEERFIRGDGRQVWVEVTAAPFHFDGLPGAQVIVRDISDRIAAREARHRLEAERAEAMERLQLVLDRMPIACIVNDTDFRFTYWNPAAERMFGWRFDEVKGRHPFDTITPPSAQPLVRDIFRRLEQSNEPITGVAENQTKDGRTITCSWVNSAFRDRGGRFIGIISMAQNITDALRAQREIRRSEASLAKAQQIAHLGSWEWDLASGNVVWSEQMYRIFGQDRASFVPQAERIASCIHPDDRDAVLRAADASIQGDAPFDIDHRIIHPDGTVRYVNSQGEVQRDESGNAVRFIGTVLDITDRKLAEEQLRNLNETLEQRVAERTLELRQANEDLEAFAYTISHDLRTPMRSMRGFAQALLEDCADGLNETCTTYARRIVAASARMDRLTQELLEYSQLSRRDLVPQRISLVLVLHDVLGQLERDPDFSRARVEIIEPMPWVLAHRPTLAAVLSNLLENAAKFVAPGVTPIIAIRAEDRGDVARVWILDNGIGIDPRHHEQIFNVFERLHGLDQFPGTGIGLAIVRRGVERMGGRVGVESQVGRGSRFWIELPKDPQSP